MIDRSKEFIAQYQKALEKALEECGKVGTAEMQSNAPVDTGQLKRSYSSGWKIIGLRCYVGTNVDYAEHVEFKPVNKGGRPHIRMSLEIHKGDFVEIIQKHLKQVKV